MYETNVVEFIFTEYQLLKLGWTQSNAQFPSGAIG